MSLQKQSSVHLHASMHQILKAYQFADVLATQNLCFCAKRFLANKMYNVVYLIRLSANYLNLRVEFMLYSFD